MKPNVPIYRMYNIKFPQKYTLPFTSPIPIPYSNNFSYNIDTCNDLINMKCEILLIDYNNKNR